jgi:hypothetical protein
MSKIEIVDKSVVLEDEVVLQFLGGTSGWSGVTITKFFTKLSPLFSNDCSESGTVWGLSGKVT